MDGERNKEREVEKQRVEKLITLIFVDSFILLYC